MLLIVGFPTILLKGAPWRLARLSKTKKIVTYTKTSRLYCKKLRACRVYLLHSTMLACSNTSVAQNWRRMKAMMRRKSNNLKMLWQLELVARCNAVSESGCHTLIPWVPGREIEVLHLMVIKTPWQSTLFFFLSPSYMCIYSAIISVYEIHKQLLEKV